MTHTQTISKDPMSFRHLSLARTESRNGVAPLILCSPVSSFRNQSGQAPVLPAVGHGGTFCAFASFPQRLLMKPTGQRDRHLDEAGRQVE